VATAAGDREQTDNRGDRHRGGHQLPVGPSVAAIGVALEHDQNPASKVGSDSAPPPERDDPDERPDGRDARGDDADPL
jgi:hypothetical protein